MSAGLLELRKKHAFAIKKAESILAAAETAGRDLTAEESMEIDTCTAAANALEPQLKEAQKKSTIYEHFSKGAVFIEDGGRRNTQTPRRQLTADYEAAFYDYIASNGQKRMEAALYEGSGSAGGFAVPITVEGNVIALAPADMGVRSIATVIPTVMDIKVPRATTISTASAKAEGTGSGSNVFTESEPTLEQFTLSAYMAGVLHQISWELAQDVPSFQQFAIGDMLLAAQLYEENLFVHGTGSGQAQGLKGNVGTGTGVAVAAGSDSYASELLDATFDIQGTLKGSYFQNASWLMARSTGVLLRKAQKQANLFVPAFTRENGKDFLHGFPIAYSTSVDAVATGNTPVYFGDFHAGYVIGDRGGSGLNVKILDQPKAAEGLIQFLCYRRMDGRVRRSEAIQSITLA